MDVAVRWQTARRMSEFVFDQNIEVGGQAKMKVVCEMRKIAAPRKRNYFDVVPLLPEIINQLAVIKGCHRSSNRWSRR